MSEYFVYTEHMAVGYGKEPMIEEISIHVRKGEILTLIGPNGSGKSTILKSLIRQLDLIAGTVWLDGRGMNDMEEGEIARRLSILMTDRIKPELMTCEDVVETGRYPYTGRLGILTPQDREKVREAMELVDAWELRDTDFTRLSDGQRQRVLLARAICQEPEIIVLDEPTSYLDVRYKLELLSILKRLVKEKNLAVVMSLHELDLAQKVSDQIVCVGKSGIERCGPPEEIFTGGYIRSLYGIVSGSYLESFGCLEMEAVKGEPEIFVIGGGGSGIPVYRRLQRGGIPFTAGILAENDLDYPVAAALASEVVKEKAFCPAGEQTYAHAVRVMARCGRVICCLKTFGPFNESCRRLKEEARMRGILEEE